MAAETGPAALATRRSILLGMLRHAGELETVEIPVPGLRAPLRVTRPTNTDLLLDQMADDPEQNLPYWSELWPSGLALASELAIHPEIVAGHRTLELGSGIGVTAAVALAGGALLTATDYAPEALALTRLTCLEHAGREPDTLQMNWRSASDQGALLRHGPFPVVLAADVLYERRDIEPLLDLLDRIVAPGGLFWLAHPGRPPARIFLERAAERGWRGSMTTHHGPWPDPKDAQVVVAVHALRRQGVPNPGPTIDKW